MTGAEDRITHYLCIGCPLGCRLEVEEGDDGEIVEVRGFSCRKGKAFAEREHTDPRRMVTTTITITGGLWRRLPVKTATEVPVDRVWDVITELRTASVAAPVEMGRVIAEDVAGTGVAVVASRAMPSR